MASSSSDPSDDGSPAPALVPDLVSVVIRNNQLDVLRQGLADGIWAKRTLVDGLFCAATVHKWDCLDALIDGGTPLTRYNRRGQTVLHRLIINCGAFPDITLKMAQKIIGLVAASTKQSQMDNFINRRCSGSEGVPGFTCLHQSIAAKHIKMATLLLEHGAKPNTRSGFYLRTPIMEGSSKGQTELVNVLLEYGASPHLLDKGGQNALIYAAQCGKVACLRRLVEAESSINVQNHTGNSALMQAAWNGHTDCIRVLLDAGADVYQTDFMGRSVLRYAVKSRKRELLEMILDVTDEIPLDLSIGKAVVEQDDVNMLKTLLERGMMVKSDKSGDSVLHTAAEMGSLNCLNVLLERKDTLELDINGINDSYGVSPLQRACAYGYYEIVTRLLINGADTDFPSRDGLTPLFYSMEVLQLVLTKTRGLDCMRELLRYGCSVDLKCSVRCRGIRLKFSMTHLAYALVSCNLFAARILVAAGAHKFDLSFLGQHQPAEIFPRELLCTPKERDAFIKQELQNPMALYQLARMAVREALDRNIEKKILLLPIPQHIKEYLNLSELEEIIEEYSKKIEKEDALLEEEFEDSLSIEESDIDMMFSSSEDTTDPEADDFDNEMFMVQERLEDAEAEDPE